MSRKFFKTHLDHLGEDLVDINDYKLTQLQKPVQYDSTNCGIFCLKVYIVICHNYKLQESHVSYLHRWLSSYLYGEGLMKTLTQGKQE